MTLVETEAPSARTRRRWPTRSTVAGVVVVVVVAAGVVGQLNELDGHGHWRVVDRVLGNPFWPAAIALLIFAVAVLLGLRRRSWWGVAWRTVAAVVVVLLAAGCALLGSLDRLMYDWRDVRRLEAPGGQALRVIVEQDPDPATYWRVDVESGHGLLRRRWPVACSLSSSGGSDLAGVTWTGPRQVRLTTDEDDTRQRLTVNVDGAGRPVSPVPAGFAC